MKGILLFAQNNDYVDYVKIACASAGYARKNLSGFDEICLVTDIHSEYDEELVSRAFDRVITLDNRGFYTNRLYRDTADDTEYAKFINASRSSVFDITPYAQTLVIDCDYFVMSNALDGVWDSHNDFMITKRYRDVSGGEDKDNNVVKIDDYSIDMYWATVFYFRKTLFTESLFSMIHNVKEHYMYYYNLYNCEGALFRNDYAFSIALHILNGNVKYTVPELPIKYLMNSYDTNDIYKVSSEKEMVLTTSTLKKSKECVLSRFKNCDLHIMNKRSIERHMDSLLEFGGLIWVEGILL